MSAPLSEDELDLVRVAFDWARAGEVAKLAQLLDAGGPVDLTNERGDTLLILAAYHGRSDTVSSLLAHGADPNRVNDNGYTALASAVFGQAADIVTALLVAGADPDYGERSARMVAQFFDLPQMTHLLA